MKRSRIGDSFFEKHGDGDGVSPNWGKENWELRKCTRSGKEYGSSDRSDRWADISLTDSQKKRVTTNYVLRSRDINSMDNEYGRISGKESCELRKLTRSGKEYGSYDRSDRGADISLTDSQKKQKRVTMDNECGRISGKKERSATSSKSSEKSGTSKGVRRSARLGRAVDQCETGDAHDLDKQKMIKKMVTRTMVHDFESKHGKVDGFTIKGVSSKMQRGLSNEIRANAGIGSCKITDDNVKRTTRSFEPPKVVESSNSNGRDRMVSRDVGKPVIFVNCYKPCRSRQDTEKCSIVEEMGEKSSECKLFFREGMKRDRVKEESEVVEGWTKNQDLALRKAFATTKPTPQFWKKVAKMVSGKSAQECFDRIYSDYSTPSKPRAHSRVTREKLASSLSFSGSKLLKKTVNLRSRRRKTFLAHKTVRQLLEKQQNEDQDYQADFFAVFEPDPVSFNFEQYTTFDSPATNQKSNILTRLEEASPSVHSIHRSRLVNTHRAAFPSPAVLKPIVNKALHERYIDQIHRRDAKRKAESLRMQRIEEKTSKKTNDLTANSVQVARDVLLSNAYDAISQIRSLQSNAMDGEDTSCSIEDGDEDYLC